MKVDTYQCDVCHAQRGVANHWWLACSQNGGFVVHPWNESLLKMDGFFHLCSESCVIKKVSEFMTRKP